MNAARARRAECPGCDGRGGHDVIVPGTETEDFILCMTCEGDGWIEIPAEAAEKARLSRLTPLYREPATDGDRKMDTEQIEAELQRRLDPANRVGVDTFCIPKIECADGLMLSVQAGSSHYCAPREKQGPWSAVEVGFPTRRVEELMPFIDGGSDTDPTDTVYGYVPISTVASVIEKAGGFKA